MENKCRDGILSWMKDDGERGQGEAGGAWWRGSASGELPEVAVGGSVEGREPEACRAVGPGRMLELHMSVGFSSDDRGEREEVQSIAETVKGARRKHSCQAEMQERLRGHWTKIPDRVFFSFSDKPPISSLSEIFE